MAIREFNRLNSYCALIMLTAVDDKANVMKAIQLGRNGYIIKPFTTDVLIQKMNAVTNKFESR